MESAGFHPRSKTPEPRPLSPGEKPERSRPGAHARQLGLSLVEATAGLAVLLLSLSGFVRMCVFADAHPAADEEQELARQAVQRVLADLQDASFADVYHLYNEDPFDDPRGVATAPGNRFRVDGLVASADDPEAPVGTILFPTLFDFDAGLQLREDVFDPDLGMPRDLNGDARVDHRDHAGDYALLPVRVRLDWRGVTGTCVLEIESLLADY